MAKVDFPLSWTQKAWKNSLLTWNSLAPFQLCSLSLSLLVSFFTFFPFCLSPFDSITLSLSLFLLHLSLTPSLSFPWSSVTCQDFFFAFFYHICLTSLCVCLHVCVCLRVSVFSPPLLFFLPDFPSSDFTLLFFSLTRYRFALPPWLTRAHTRTDAHIPFSLSVRLIWISTCLPALARCLPSSGNTAERRGGTPKAQPP